MPPPQPPEPHVEDPFLSQARKGDLFDARLTQVPDPSQGLPDPVFDFVLRLVPMVNVDLFVTGAGGRVLLAWREDQFADGWHVPGGIVRGTEAIETRLALTAKDELGASLRTVDGPAAILQLFGDRGHFISLVYRCGLEAAPSRRVVTPAERPAAGDLCWFDDLPPLLYPTHEAYRPLWSALRRSTPALAPMMETLRVSERAQGSRGWSPG